MRVKCIENGNTRRVHWCRLIRQFFIRRPKVFNFVFIQGRLPLVHNVSHAATDLHMKEEDDAMKWG